MFYKIFVKKFCIICRWITVAIVHIIMLMCTGLVESCKRVTCKREVPVQAFEERCETNTCTVRSVLYLHLITNTLSTYEYL